MPWLAELLKSSATAAVITGIVAAIGFCVSAATAKKINRDKLELDKELAQARVQAEVALAERKAALDKGVALAKRKAEVAEKVLAEFYEVRRAFEAIRSPMIWAEEMLPEDGVADELVRNDGYSVRRRMKQYSAMISKLEASRFTFGALFGHPATSPYTDLVKVWNKVSHAAGSLQTYRHQQDAPNLQGFLQSMRRVAFSNTQLGDDGAEVPDQISADIDAFVATIEAACRPSLEIT